jgi:hypothetical protein
MLRRRDPALEAVGAELVRGFAKIKSDGKGKMPG